MRIVQEQPPFIDELGKVFRLPESVVFTFGEIVYNPSGRDIDLPLMRHEEVHSKQQGEDPGKWWKRYIADPAFRLSQEIPAYKVQYKEMKKYIKDRNKLSAYAMALARDLSGDIYGRMIKADEAYKLIRW